MGSIINAETLFKAMREHSSAESVISDALLKACGCNPENTDTWPCEDITFDDYDGSFEFKDTKVGWNPTREHLKAWWRLGFMRCWICYTDGGEKYYYD